MTETANILIGICYRCRQPILSSWQYAYCDPCKKLRKKRRFRGVDIDAIHFNPRWMKKKEAA